MDLVPRRCCVPAAKPSADGVFVAVGCLEKGDLRLHESIAYGIEDSTRENREAVFQLAGEWLRQRMS